MENKEVCEICEKKFSRKDSLYRHKLNVHKLTRSEETGTTITCPVCRTERFRTNAALRIHLNEQHHVSVQKEEFVFKSMEEFQSWKEKEERETNSTYIQERAPKEKATEETNFTFRCHRSGFFSPRGTGKRKLKSQGTNKINATCPARLEVIFDHKSHLVRVCHYKTHVGHTCEMGLVKLSKEEKAVIAGKISEGVSFQRILDDIRESTWTENFRRLHLICRKDLLNISRNCQERNPEKRHADDAMSVFLWVQEMKSLGEDSPVVYSKFQGDVDTDGVLAEKDVMIILMTKFQEHLLSQFGEIICIDGTHGTNPYEFELHTLLTVDDYGAGCPVAFCITNISDEKHMLQFFKKVKKRCGDVQCKAFMTDDYPAYYNAWVQVMSKPEKQLLCFWHVDKNWRKQILKVKGSSEKKALVYKSLRTILMEQDENKFGILLSNLLEELFADPETKDFGTYFKDHYANRVNLWAFCHRLKCGINTNMYLEAFHRTIKHIYLEGRKTRRLDTLINALMKFSRDLIFDRLSKLTKNKASKRISDIHSSHNQAKVMDFSAVKENGAQKWDVVSSDKEKTYLVTSVGTTCPCNLKCCECKACVHMFTCECLDYMVRFNMCKHIHLCILKYNLVSECDIVSGQEERQEEVTTLINMIKEDASSENEQSKQVKDMMRKIEMITGLASHITNQDVSEVHRDLDRLISTLNRLLPDKVLPPVNKKHPSNEKIEPQVRGFRSSKKKRLSHQLNLSHATASEAQSILQSLENVSVPVLNIHTGVDHTYA